MKYEIEITPKKIAIAMIVATITAWSLSNVYELGFHAGELMMLRLGC